MNQAFSKPEVQQPPIPEEAKDDTNDINTLQNNDASTLGKTVSQMDSTGMHPERMPVPLAGGQNDGFGGVVDEAMARQTA